ncbi:FAD-dependent monooxygenase [Adhaeribacter aquaticus]|uniref:FAD-dependent monooxygenase n=1 Tax=Adhaeribacter aquaticus TaxID=299567 RepID=UPI00040076DF|nr:FAD-dependent monooxygenase [Adhaeribacter aquaticus]
MKTGIIGAGIAGLSTAIALRQIGIEPVIYEAASELKPVGAGIVLAANAMKVFRKLGIAEDLIAAGRSLNALTILNQHGKILDTTNSLEISKQYGLDNFIIHRADLHHQLLQHVDLSSLYKNKKAINVIQDTTGVKVYFEDGTTEVVDNLIVADGIHSPIRQKLLPRVRPRYAGYTCWRAVIENPGISLNQATETWGAKGRFGIAPLPQNKIYWFACVNAEENNSALKHYTAPDLLKLFHDFHAPIPQILESSYHTSLIWNDICDLPNLAQYAFGNIVLIGDASHATTPNLGQGACQAIEDAWVLAKQIQAQPTFSEAAKHFERLRKDRTQWIINNSYRVGQLAQLQNKLLITLRNQLMPLIPKFVKYNQLKKLYEVDY